jgi:hypothetical protein
MQVNFTMEMARCSSGLVFLTLKNIIKIHSDIMKKRDLVDCNYKTLNHSKFMEGSLGLHECRESSSLSSIHW